MSPADPPRIVRCPACGGASSFAAANPWRPFCCERCRSLDLGAWASEAYRIGAEPEPDSDAKPKDPRPS